MNGLPVVPVLLKTVRHEELNLVEQPDAVASGMLEAASNRTDRLSSPNPTCDDEMDVTSIARRWPLIWGNSKSAAQSGAFHMVAGSEGKMIAAA